MVSPPTTEASCPRGDQVDITGRGLSLRRPPPSESASGQKCRSQVPLFPQLDLLLLLVACSTSASPA